MSDKQSVGSGLQGITRLITDATLGVVNIVESMHRRVVHPPLLPASPIQHLITQIAGITYNNIRWSTQLIGGVLDKGFGQISSLLGNVKSTDEREAIRAVLNGVVGDYLEKNSNPLKITMQFKYQGKTIPLNPESLKTTYPAINGKLLVMVHGLCMNDIQWSRNEHNHGTNLANDLNKTIIYLHYNSGLHISTNGKKFNTILEQLVIQWPVPVEELNIVAYSMGGLVTRSAVHYGQQQNTSWTKYLKKIIFLGTPHHGTSLEQAGNYLDVILENIHYTKPFAQFGKIRSAGVTDLRYGNLLDEDWEEENRFKFQGDQRKNIPLPEGVDCFSIAGSMGKKLNSASTRLPGDKLVSLNSAFGQHKNAEKNLNFKKQNTWIVHDCTHAELLSKPDVYSKMKEWLM